MISNYRYYIINDYNNNSYEKDNNNYFGNFNDNYYEEDSYDEN